MTVTDVAAAAGCARPPAGQHLLDQEVHAFWLAAGDALPRIALRRVSDGGVTRLSEWWRYRGRRVPGYVTDALTTLRDSGLVTVADPEPGGMARVALTDAGAARFEQLCQTAGGMFAAQFRARYRRFGVTDPDW